ncbi:MAG: hypothetical protein ACQXXH_08145, partial [Candidatus Bathyarchaeia archaeon]|nr:hypothetical protein [Candidatus Bathyarchaeota archaeon A05DMB-4]
WNSTGRDKLAIVMYGGLAYIDSVRVLSLFSQDPTGEKEKLVYDLYANGYDVVSPWHDDYPGNGTWYYGADDWVYNVIVWAHQKGYHYLYLFGFLPYFSFLHIKNVRSFFDV